VWQSVSHKDTIGKVAPLVQAQLPAMIFPNLFLTATVTHQALAQIKNLFLSLWRRTGPFSKLVSGGFLKWEIASQHGFQLDDLGLPWATIILGNLNFGHLTTTNHLARQHETYET